jgi:hypothetical protein
MARSGVIPSSSTNSSISRACQWPQGVRANPLSDPHRMGTPASKALRTTDAAALISPRKMSCMPAPAPAPTARPWSARLARKVKVGQIDEPLSMMASRPSSSMNEA